MHISEISVLVIESTAVSVTAALLCELIKKKVKVIFCDEKHNPLSDLRHITVVTTAVLKLKDKLRGMKR